MMKTILLKIEDEKGQAAVEFALVALLLLLLIVGIAEFGRAWFHADVLKGYANTVARTYAVKGAAAGQTMKTSLINDALINRNITITIDFTCNDASGGPRDCDETTAPLPVSVTATVEEPQFKVAAGLITMLKDIKITRTATYRLEQ
jgi:Flp pilus assembly protein TadG